MFKRKPPVKKEVPLLKEIESKFGKCFIMDINFGISTSPFRYIVKCSDILKEADNSLLDPLLVWNEDENLFYFNGNKYSKEDFIRVMNLLVFV